MPLSSKFFRAGWPVVSVLCLAVLLVGVTFSLPLYRAHAARSCVERCGGRVATAPGGPDWLRALVGSRRLEPLDPVWQAQITFEALRQPRSTIRECASQLPAFSALRWLALTGTDVQDADIVHVAQLKSLEILSLSSTALTDRGLECVEGLTGLNDLDLTRTAVGDAGLAHLKNLKHLENLALDSTGVTDAGLVHLKELKSLRRLSVSNTQVTPAGLEALVVALPKLEVTDD